MPRLEQWSVIADHWRGFIPPTTERKFLHGQIFDDEVRSERKDLPNRKFSDGDHVFTSQVKTLDLANKSAQTLNTLYQLGEPSSAYVKWCAEHGIELLSAAEQTTVAVAE